MVKNIIFGLVMLLYIAFPIQMIYTHERVLTEGEVFLFKPQPIDPHHPFKGKYVRLNFGQPSVFMAEAHDRYAKGDEMFLSLGQDENGFAIPENMYQKAPEDTPYLKVNIKRISKENQIYFDYPFKEYYLNEELAPKAEKLYQQLRQNEDQQDLYVEVRVKKGKALIEDLYIDGVRIEEYLRAVD